MYERAGENQAGDSVKVESLPCEDLSISMFKLGLQRSSIITSGWRMSSDYQHDKQ